MVSTNISISFKTFVPAQEAKPVAPLGPLIGQYGLNLKQFCDDVNKLTTKYTKGMPLPIHVTKSTAYPNGYSIIIRAPTSAFLFSAEFFSEEAEFCERVKSLEVKRLYKIVQVYSYFHNLGEYRSAKVALSYLRSLNAPVLIIKE